LVVVTGCEGAEVADRAFEVGDVAFAWPFEGGAVVAGPLCPLLGALSLGVKAVEDPLAWNPSAPTNPAAAAAKVNGPRFTVMLVRLSLGPSGRRQRSGVRRSSAGGNVVALSQGVYLGVHGLFWYAETVEHLNGACDKVL
jgi:hypothetical protein